MSLNTKAIPFPVSRSAPNEVVLGMNNLYTDAYEMKGSEEKINKSAGAEIYKRATKDSGKNNLC